MNEIEQLKLKLKELLETSQIKPTTEKGRSCERAFLFGYAFAKGGVHKLPPAVYICLTCSRSILTLNTQPD